MTLVLGNIVINVMVLNNRRIMLGMFSFMQDADDYESRKVSRIEPKDNNGCGVSTAYSSDEGYETALLDKNGAHPVERYENKEEATIGHKKWVKKAKTIKKTVELGGLSGLVGDKKYVICR